MGINLIRSNNYWVLTKNLLNPKTIYPNLTHPCPPPPKKKNQPLDVSVSGGFSFSFIFSASNHVLIENPTASKLRRFLRFLAFLSDLHRKLKIFKPSHHLLLSTKTLASLFPSLSVLLFEHEALRWRRRRRLRVSAVTVEGEAESKSESDLFDSLACAPKQCRSCLKVSGGRSDAGAR